MNLKSLKASAILATILVGGAVSATAAEAAKEDAEFATKLVGAIENFNYPGFIFDGEAPFQQLKPDAFFAVASKLAPKLKTGHELTYLGNYQQHGYRVSLWKISFKGGGDDLLATLSVKDGKVGGFYIK